MYYPSKLPLGSHARDVSDRKKVSDKMGLAKTQVHTMESSFLPYSDLQRVCASSTVERSG